MNETVNKIGEAGGIAFTTYKRADGFEVSLTIRDVDGKTTLERLDAAITAIKASGGVPTPLRGGFQKGQQRPVEYVQGRVCPTCGQQLVYATTKTGKKLIKCSTQRWDAQQNRPTGCPFTEWLNTTPQQQQAQSYNQHPTPPSYGESRGKNDEQDYGY